MRHAILFTLLVLQVVGFTWMEGHSELDYSSGGSVATYFLGHFQSAVLDRAPLVMLTLGAALTLTIGSIDLSLVAIAALVGAVMSRFDPGNPILYGAVPIGILVGAALGTMHGFLVGASLRRAAFVTLAALLAYTTATHFVVGDPGSAFASSGYDIFAKNELEWVLIVGGTITLGVITTIIRRRLTPDPHPLDPEPTRVEPATVRRVRLGVFALAGVFAAIASLMHTAEHFTVSFAWPLRDTAPMLAALVIGGWFATRRPLPGLAMFLAVTNVCVLDHGLTGMYYAHGDALPVDPQTLTLPILVMAMAIVLCFDRAPRRTESE